MDLEYSYKLMSHFFFLKPYDAEALDDDELDLLHEFLVHIDEYVHYPRSKLTVLLRVRGDGRRFSPIPGGDPKGAAARLRHAPARQGRDRAGLARVVPSLP